MELRLNIDDEFLKNITNKLGPTYSKATDVTREALTIYKWAVDEVSNGRVLFSAKGDDDLHKLVMPSLQTVKDTSIPEAKTNATDSN